MQLFRQFGAHNETVGCLTKRLNRPPLIKNLIAAAV